MPVKRYDSSPIQHPWAVNGSLSHGWVDGCDKRGTLDLLWSCLSTLFICLWIMVHLNLPATHESYWDNFLRKLRWFVMAALLPEVLLLAAGGQWASAKRSTTNMRASGHEHWTLSHGFYADMGGIVLQPPDYRSFPITAHQLHYLAVEKYVAAPDISEKQIADKSKADLFAKAFLCVQASWFVAQCIGRGIQSLAISPLELYTCGIILCTTATALFWMKKPLDVTTPIVLPTTTPLATILLRGGESAREPFKNTPLDFAEPNAYAFDRLPRLARHYGPHKGPLLRLPNDRNPQLGSLTQRACIGLVTAAFSTIHFVDWHFAFPTRTEQLLWWIACVVAEASLAFHGLLEAKYYRPSRNHTFYLAGYKTRWPLSLFYIVPASLHLVARLMTVIVAISSLRALPVSSYASVQWAAILPHV